MRIWRNSERPEASGQEWFGGRAAAKVGAASARCTPQFAFTLVEVLIAIGIFFMVGFAILGMVVTGLGAARSLQVRHADVGMLAAEMAATNSILEEGVESGDFGDFYPNARWEREITEVGSNGLYQVDFKVYEKVGRNEVASQMSILLHSPNSPRGRLSGGTGRSTGVHPIQ